MDEWVEGIIDKAEELAGEGLCDHCLGRMFGKVGTGMTNDERGLIIRNALKERGVEAEAEDFCPLCENVFDLLGRFAESAAESITSVESDNFLIGTKIEPEIAKKEKEIKERYGLENMESLKTELNREIGKLALPNIHRPVEFKNPQVVACVDTRFGNVALDVDRKSVV